MSLFAGVCFEDLEFAMPSALSAPRAATVDFAPLYRARIMASSCGPGLYDVTIMNDFGSALRMVRGLPPQRVTQELQRVAAETRAELSLLPAFP